MVTLVTYTRNSKPTCQIKTCLANNSRRNTRCPALQSANSRVECLS